VVGELRDPRAAALPAIAALGGMIVPACIYILFNAGGAEFDGWGIPMATDIAFAVGVVSLLGDRVPSAMKVFLLTLAIVDDIGAIAVIAVFYTDDFSTGWFLVAIAGILVVLAMRLVRVWWIPAYVLVGAFVWLAALESGIHATIAGVVLGLITPATPLKGEARERDIDDVIRLAVRGDASAPVVRRANFELKEQVSVVERLEDVLHPFSSYMIIPVFALANAGVMLSGDTLSAALTSPVTLGVALGLVLGKFIGVSLATFIAVKSGIATLPRAASWIDVFGLAAMAGIGFTVSLFVTGLAFEDPLIADEARIGILVASTVAAVLGTLILRRSSVVLEVGADDPVPTGA
jgi:NhaA family Na+:H+ antiporter